jgi:hypothetical protein
MTIATVDLGKIKFQWKGDWSSSASYTRDDVVHYQGQAYVCKLANTNSTPTVGSADWDLLAAGGDPATVMTNQGDLLVRGAGGLERLAQGNSNTFLKVGTNGPEWGYTPGQTIETLSGYCDGGTQTVLSGTYTFDTAYNQSLSTNYATISGSILSYTPPPGTTRVVYEFNYKLEDEGYGGISHWRFYIDNYEIYPAYRCYTFSYDSGNNQHAEMDVLFRVVIDCAAAEDDPYYAKFTSWTTPKTLQIQGRDYSSSYQMGVHANTWRDGTSSGLGVFYFAAPTLTITSYA